MLSKSKLKYIKSLQLKKYRKEEQCFVVEGAKSVIELLSADFQIHLVAATAGFIDQYARLLTKTRAEIVPASAGDLAAAGSLETNDAAIAVVVMKPNVKPVTGPGEFVLALDDIRDPGNLGTIIRTADWYGIRHIIASQQTADCYNPKAISASVGSFLRVDLFYTSLTEYLANKLHVYGAFLNGKSVHETSFGNGGIIVIGNESTGISAEVAQFVQAKIKIPQYGSAESLNAGVATAVILDNLRRLQK